MVKCTDCGFLAIRRHFERHLAEVEGEIRNGKEWPVQHGTNICLYEKRPLCLISHTIGTKDGLYSAIEFKEAINIEKDCKDFYEWRQGSTPQEHREMLDREQWQNWQAKQRKEDKHWRIIELVVLGLLAVLMAGGFTVLGAFIEQGM